MSHWMPREAGGLGEEVARRLCVWALSPPVLRSPSRHQAFAVEALAVSAPQG